MQYRARDNYQYGQKWTAYDFDPVSGSAIAALTPVPKSIRIDTDADFIVEKTTYQLTFDGAIATGDDSPIANGFTVQIYDSTTGRYWYNTWTAVDTVFGVLGTLPFILPTPKVLLANSEITINLRFNDEITRAESPLFGLTLNFHGNKLFR